MNKKHEQTVDPKNADDANAETPSHNAVVDLAAELEAAVLKAEQHREQYLRAAAELENVRRRAERDLENAHKYGIDRFANELLGVKDSLDLGLQAADENADAASLKEGLELTAKILDQALAKFGIEVIDPAGQPFDPEFHEAMAVQPSGQVAPDTVLTVVQKGYRIHGRLLRPAMVIVASAP